MLQIIYETSLQKLLCSCDENEYIVHVDQLTDAGIYSGMGMVVATSGIIFTVHELINVSMIMIVLEHCLSHIISV